MSRLVFAALMVVSTLFFVDCQDSVIETVLAKTPTPAKRSNFHIGEPLVVKVVGRDCRWEVTYPGPDGELLTGDDIAVGNHLHVPSGVPVRFLLESADFVYSFALPELKLQEIAVPEMTFRLHVSQQQPGSLTLRGGQFCGDRRNELSGTMVVQSPAEWIAWLQRAGERHD